MSWLPADTHRMHIMLCHAFGFTVLLLYFTLALCIALFNVEEKTSFGLPTVLEALKPLGILYGGWAFGQMMKGEAK